MKDLVRSLHQFVGFNINIKRKLSQWRILTFLGDGLLEALAGVADFMGDLLLRPLGELVGRFNAIGIVKYITFDDKNYHSMGKRDRGHVT